VRIAQAEYRTRKDTAVCYRLGWRAEHVVSITQASVNSTSAEEDSASRYCAGLGDWMDAQYQGIPAAHGVGNAIPTAFAHFLGWKLEKRLFAAIAA